MTSELVRSPYRSKLSKRCFGFLDSVLRLLQYLHSPKRSFEGIGTVVPDLLLGWCWYPRCLHCLITSPEPCLHGNNFAARSIMGLLSSDWLHVAYNLNTYYTAIFYPFIFHKFDNNKIGGIQRFVYPALLHINYSITFSQYRVLFTSWVKMLIRMSKYLMLWYDAQ